MTTDELRYATAVFDLDGTLLDTLQDLFCSVNHALVTFGLPERSLAEVRLFTGNGIRRLIEQSVPAGTSQEITDRVFEEFKRHYDKHKLDRTHPYPGMPEAISQLRHAGVRCAVVSNKADFAVQGIIATYYPDTFDGVLGGRDGMPLKPNRAMVDAVVASLGTTEQGMVYVGDSEVDIETARNVGCDALLCSWGFRGREWLVEHGATTIVDTPQQLVAAILG